jgi:hypothetical protein
MHKYFIYVLLKCMTSFFLVGVAYAAETTSAPKSVFMKADTEIRENSFDNSQSLQIYNKRPTPDVRGSSSGPLSAMKADLEGRAQTLQLNPLQPISRPTR